MREEIKLEERVSQYESMAFEATIDLEKAHMALNELLNEYEWEYKPTAQKALEYGSAMGKEVYKCDKEAKFSYKYLKDYKKIMWLARVALDYMDTALSNIQEVYEG